MLPRDDVPETDRPERDTVAERSARPTEGRVVEIARRRVIARLRAVRGELVVSRHPREKLLTLLKDAEPGTVFERLPGQLELFPEVEAAELRLLDGMFDWIEANAAARR